MIFSKSRCTKIWLSQALPEYKVLAAFSSFIYLHAQNILNSKNADQRSREIFLARFPSKKKPG